MLNLIKNHKFKVIIFLSILIMALPEIFHQNSGTSISIGSFSNGQMSNGYLLPLFGKNFSYFSLSSYYLMDNAYVHSNVHNTIIEAYSSLEKICPSTHFSIMECANKDGGKLLIHRTHQLGLSVDFMVPKIDKIEKGQVNWLDHLGLFHYLLTFDEAGSASFNSSIKIDFETMAKHLLALDDACKTNHLAISKIIFNTKLQPLLFKSKLGEELKKRNLYFVKSLTPFINKIHDDHYHVDFKVI